MTRSLSYNIIGAALTVTAFAGFGPVAALVVGIFFGIVAIRVANAEKRRPPTRRRY